VNRYTEYQDIVFSKKSKNTDILEDSDKDGFNNLNEWILDSNAADSTSVPVQPTPTAVDALYDLDFLNFFGFARLVRNQYYGFTINKKLATSPGVVYTLQRSKDGGTTWTTFKDGYYYSDGTYSATLDPTYSTLTGTTGAGLTVDWFVDTVTLAPGIGSPKENSPRRVEIRVESGYPVLDIGGLDYVQDQPPGTANDQYRVKITLAK
jgi:hypothetical protein